ncbi:VOC family protein [Gordonia phthalatica]|uniref:VOC domain-containing protein n=1 Tax=Gordonia phthalatica TaxID=1136941 RepID=A0A0N9NK13_9ACTN|nr:VOC family protein [Gordonia phthalatica]ALG86336.1 hypothetical protein ACH46_19905 [Gordonia phthalatica]
MTPLNLIVLYVADIDSSRNFYAALGLPFTQEKHGAGPIHYSTELPGGAVLELYPRGGSASSRARLGFTVTDLPAAIAALQEVTPGALLRAPADLAYGHVAVVKDPDGNKIELVAA